MKIAILTNLYPPFVRGGADFLTHHLAQELARQGHQVSVVTSVPWRSVKKFAPELREEGGVRVYRFYPLNLYHYLSAARVPYPLRFVWQAVNLWNVPAARTVVRILRREQPDLVVSANLMGLSFLLPRAVAKLGLKHVHVLHDVQLLHPSGLFRWGQRPGGALSALYQSATRALFAPVGVVVSPSQWLLEEHERRGFFRPARGLVLPNPVPLAQAEPATKHGRAPFRLVYVGQLEEHKGIVWLLQALQGYGRQDFELHVYALGQKPKLALIRELVARDQRLKLHDIVSQAEIDAAYAGAHLTLVPSLCYENSPLAIPVSFAAGTPVLAARIGGIPELVHEGTTGWLFTPGDAADLLRQLTWCLDNPGAMLQAGLTASRAFADRTLEAYAKQLLALSLTKVEER